MWIVFQFLTTDYSFPCTPGFYWALESINYPWFEAVSMDTWYYMNKDEHTQKVFCPPHPPPPLLPFPPLPSPPTNCRGLNSWERGLVLIALNHTRLRLWVVSLLLRAVKVRKICFFIAFLHQIKHSFCKSSQVDTSGWNCDPNKRTSRQSWAIGKTRKWSVVCGTRLFQLTFEHYLSCVC